MVITQLLSSAWTLDGGISLALALGGWLVIGSGGLDALRAVVQRIRSVLSLAERREPLGFVMTLGMVLYPLLRGLGVAWASFVLAQSLVNPLTRLLALLIGSPAPRDPVNLAALYFLFLLVVAALPFRLYRLATLAATRLEGLYLRRVLRA